MARTIVMRPGVKFNSRDMIKQFAGLSPVKQISVEDMRKRVRVLDAVDDLDPKAETMILESGDWEALKAATNEFPFAVADKELLRIVDDILEAKPTSVIENQKTKKAG